MIINLVSLNKNIKLDKINKNELKDVIKNGKID